jgi:hypothetical protein
MEKIFSFSALSRVARCIGALGFVMCFHANSFAQPNRIPQTIDSSRRFTLHGNLHPIANSSYDRGRVDASLKLDRLTLILKSSDTQSAELDGLLTELHNPQSPNYHKWLTPESYACTGYDLVTGLGSLDVSSFFAAWNN